MPEMNDTNIVKKQYNNDDNLSVRRKLYEKHSTNKQEFNSWLFEKYEFKIGFRILEVGCGNGAQWQNRIGELPDECSLVLSDLSPGMVNVVWGKYSSHRNMLSQIADIMDIPFPDDCFDVIIANHMLYHVPDLQKALSEVKRVLKSAGKFYTATNGNGGMRPFLHNALKQIKPETKAFTETFPFSLQDGKEMLSGYFDDVQRHDFVNSLSITETCDLMNWIKSTITMSNHSEKDFSGLYEYFEDIRVKEGTINIPLETGLFISEKY